MTPCWLLVLLCSSPLWHPEGVEGWGLSTVPSESECRPYIEKALKELAPETQQEAVDATGSQSTTTPSQSPDQEGSIEETEEATTKESIEGEPGEEGQAGQGESKETAETTESTEATQSDETTGSAEATETGEATDSAEGTETGETTESAEDVPKGEVTTGSEEELQADEPRESTESSETHVDESAETEDEKEATDQSLEDENESSIHGEKEAAESTEDTASTEQSGETHEEGAVDDQSIEAETKSGEDQVDETTESAEQETEAAKSEGLEESGEENPDETADESAEKTEASEEAAEDHTEDESTEIPEVVENTEQETTESTEEGQAEGSQESAEAAEKRSAEESEAAESTEPVSKEEIGEAAETDSTEKSAERSETSAEETKDVSLEDNAEASKEDTKEVESTEETTETKDASGEETTSSSETTQAPSEEGAESKEEPAEVSESTEDKIAAESAETIQATPTTEEDKESIEEKTEEQEETEEDGAPKEQETTVEDQLTLEFDIPKVRRAREHIAEILHLTPESAETELLLAKTIESTLKELKRVYDTAIKPLEILYKYRDLSNRHFGDPEIFSKPLILFMGPWSGGKSTIVNYLLDNEFKSSSLRTGAEPSPAYFNILMWGDREEVLDGTQLAADWTFSGLQKFGQGLLDRLRGLRLNNPLLEKVNIVEIPGILEIRKQVERLFPFNDACQWFIDRADIIFLVYDPSKLDVGPETEAILDQLKGREYQTRIILNKADQVKPEELMRVQGTLIWNISPLMSSQEPPVMYSTSLWSIPYEQGAPSRLLHAQERAFLRDLRQAIDKRVENKIASARRFAVRVRNHAKMVDCYLTTYYNHKTFFGNRKKVADDIIEHPQNYHIYEGLSTLTNISRYDLPDPEVYRDFFRLNNLYDFQRLSDTCTYFRGCPINRLDVAISYELPELVGKYHKQAEKVLESTQATKS